LPAIDIKIFQNGTARLLAGFVLLDPAMPHISLGYASCLENADSRGHIGDIAAEIKKYTRKGIVAGNLV